MQKYAVLTGDLVASSELSPSAYQAIIAHLKALATELSTIKPGLVLGDIDVFRGDGWQLCLSDPNQVLFSCTFLRSGLKAHKSGLNIDSRIGVGIGEVTQLIPEKVSESSGPAFTHSGAALDTMQDKHRLKLVFPELPPEQERLLNTIALPFMDLELTQWSTAESFAAFGALRGWTQQQTAESSIVFSDKDQPLSQQAVGKALKRIHWNTHWAALFDDSSAINLTT